MNYDLTPELKKAIKTAQSKAREHAQAQFSSGHLLWGLLHEEVGLHPVLEHLNKEVHKMRNWAERRIDRYPKATQLTEHPPGDQWIEQTMREANQFRKKNFVEAIRPVHVLHAICQPGVAFTEDYLRRFPISTQELADYLGEETVMQELQTALSSNAGTGASKTNLATALEKYCDDLTLRARQGKIDPVLGRDTELKKLVEILGKRTSPNVLLVGEPGVGKTAIAGGLALSILSERVPMHLKNATILELDVSGRLVAGAYKGEVEERLKHVLQAVKAHGNAILFIDEIHALLDERGSVGTGAVNILKPELARGELTVIGATTQVEFQRHFNTDPAFERRFTKVDVEEPNEDRAIEMVSGIIDRFEAHHQMEVESEAIPEAVHLAKRYIGTKRLPVSAIELLDLTLSSLRVMNETSEIELERLTEELITLEQVEPEASQLRKLKAFHEEINGRLSNILISQQQTDTDITTLNTPETYLAHYRKLLDTFRGLAQEKPTQATKEHIASIVAYLTGIPVGKLQSKEQEKLLNMEALLRKRVVGQNHALQVVSDTLRRSRAGLKEANKPIGVFFLVGPTGTGKTELAKAIAELLFNDPNALLRFDMSEYKEEHAAALLYGAPPGYVGYKEGGLLVNQIRQRPYSVVLFDEIEKAHSNVYDVFLQIIDEGTVKDKLNKKGNFSNAIVVFTSNIGADWIVSQFNEGKIPDQDDMRTFMSELSDDKERKYFRPEFLARRMNFIPFSPIRKEVAGDILQIHFKNFCKMLKKQNIELSLTKNAAHLLVSLGFSDIFGARPLKDAIEYHLGTTLANYIIEGKIEKGDIVVVDSLDEQTFDWNISKKLNDNE